VLPALALLPAAQNSQLVVVTPRVVVAAAYFPTPHGAQAVWTVTVALTVTGEEGT
jgi:hypothetical protein